MTDLLARITQVLRDNRYEFPSVVARRVLDEVEKHQEEHRIEVAKAIAAVDDALSAYRARGAVESGVQ